MKECPSCKTKNRNDADFCTECGADLKDVPAATDEWAAAAESLLNKAKETATTGAKKAKEAAQTGVAKVQKAMEDADKKTEAAKAAGVSSGGWDTAVDTHASAPVGGAPQKGSSILVDQSESIVATISFPGGSFGFDVKYYPIADIRDFQRQLHLLKDYRKEVGAA